MKEQLFSIPVPICRFTLAGACHIDGNNPVFVDKRFQLFSGLGYRDKITVNQEMGLAQLSTVLSGQRSPAGKGGEKNNQCAVAVDDILSGPLLVAATR